MAEEKADAPSFRISYFPILGRGAPLRCAASIGGISYEEHFVGFAEHKQQQNDGKRRWKGLPELTVYDSNGKEVVTIAQSNACLRYIGSLCGLYPDNQVQRALVDEVLDSVEDVSSMLTPSYREKNAEKKKEMRLALMKDSTGLTYWAKKFEQRFQENEKRGAKNGYVAGDKLTVADIKLFFSVNNFMSGGVDYVDGKELFKDCKGINAFYTKLSSDEKIKKFLTDFAGLQKEYKENKTNDFKRAGKGAYGSY